MAARLLLYSSSVQTYKYITSQIHWAGRSFDFFVFKFLFSTLDTIKWRFSATWEFWHPPMWCQNIVKWRLFINLANIIVLPANPQDKLLNLKK